MNELTLTAGQFRKLVESVLPCAGTDDMLPVLTAVKIETRGVWLMASATDRFKLAMKRVRAPEAGAWPEFSALVPARSIRKILALYKPMRGHLDPELTLSVQQDRLTVTAGGGFDGLAAASTSYFLMDGEYPKLEATVIKALSEDPTPMHTGFSWTHLSAFKTADTGPGLSVRGFGESKALLVMGEDFVGLVMPRKFAYIAGDDGWGDLLTKPAEPAAKKAAKKAPAKQLAAV